MRCGAALLALPLAALLVAALPAGALPAGALPAGALPAGALPVGALPAEAQKELLDSEAFSTKDCKDCPRCPPYPANCTYYDSTGLDEYYYNVDGGDLALEWTEAYVKLSCRAGLALDAASLPAFPSLALRAAVRLEACPAPRGDLRAALLRLNISVLDALDLRDLPPAPPLPRDMFAGLAGLLSLSLGAAPGQLLEPPPELLEPLAPAGPGAPGSWAGLRQLALTDVRMSPAALARLPASLVSLALERCRLGEVPARALGRLAALRYLTLRDRNMTRAPPLEAAPALRSLFLVAPLVELPRLDRLENVSLAEVRDVRLRGSCAALRRLSVAAAAALPAAWLHGGGAARCPLLEELRLSSLALSALPPDLLRGQAALRALTLSHCRRLRALPPELFRDARALRRLALQHDALELLPAGLFAPLRQLEELDLSGNRLKALGGVGSLAALRVLRLDRNPLGDTCGGSSPDATLYASELSALHGLRELRELSAAHTGATRLCEDWRRALTRLVTIDFSYNALTELTYSDMLWYGEGRRLDLRGNPLRAVTVSPANYRGAALDRRYTSLAVLTLDAELNCTCHTYWAARALQEARLNVELVGLACAGADAAPAPAPSLADAPLDAMTCAEPRACPPRCACALHPPDGRLVLHCAPRPALPDLAAAARLSPHVELRLAGAALAALPDALPPRLRALDLRGAALPAATEAQAAALLAGGRVVSLEGARLACACAAGARPALLRALLARPDQAPGLRAARCTESGRLLADEPPCEGSGGAAWLGALGALAGAALGLGAAWRAARRDSRLRLKVFLLARGLCAGWARRDDDDDCPYDVFVSFSHRDFGVASQIVRELEAGPRPLRVCVHYRDWRPGEWIPEQIARSVRQSRRTLVLMSEHFARSEWARAELREAAARALRDVTPRLVVVQLQRAAPALDAELAHLVRGNTYARWGERAFWDRLRLALPPPRPPPRAAPPPPPAPQPAPPTPVIKFSQMDFPSPIKKHVTETSPCA